MNLLCVSYKLQAYMENPITLEEERKVWTIHQSVNGITYYYNRSTKKSQYQMPECFKITEEDLDHPDWKQYRTAEGRKFYYNALTRKSCWHMPAEVKEWKLKIEEQKRLERQQRGDDAEDEKLSQADQIRKKFMTLLKSKSITVNTKWDACIKLCEDDDRWNLLPRMADKKKYFQDYVAELKKINQLEKKAKVEANRIQFMKMLKEHKKLTSDCKMHKVQFDFITDPRWRILEGADKENAYQDYMDELLIKEKEEARISKERNIENLKMLLEEQQISHNTKWDEFRSMFRNNECYKKLHPLDRINTFTAYVIEAQKKHDQDQIHQKKIQERTNRINFRNLIKEKLLSGAISYKAKWKQFLKECKSEDSLLNMLDPHQQGTSAHEIFEVFMHQIRGNHKLFKTQIKTHFKNSGFKMNQDTTYEQFGSKLVDLPLYQEAKPILQEYFYSYFKQKIKSKHQAKIEKEKEKEKQKLNALKKAQKKEKRAIFKIFKQIREQTKTKYNISEHIGFIEENLKIQNIAISHENIFKYYLAYLETEGDQNNHRSRSSSSEHSTEKKKKKSAHKEHNHHHHQDDSIKKKPTPPLASKTITIPAELKTIPNNADMDIEQQGEIKDEEPIEVPVSNPSKAAVEKKDRSDSSSSSRDKKKKKHKKKKSKAKASSSDSD